MCWRPNSAAPNPAEGVYTAPQNLLLDLRGPLRDGEGNRKRDVKEMGREKGRKGKGKVVEGMRGTGQE